MAGVGVVRVNGVQYGQQQLEKGGIRGKVWRYMSTSGERSVPLFDRNLAYSSPFTIAPHVGLTGNTNPCVNMC